jgi:hypothetical protein
MYSAVVLSYPTPLPPAGKQIKPLTRENAMNADSVGEIIATRQLYYLDDAIEKRIVCVLIGKPQPSTGSSEYECSFQIIGLGNQQATKARGHDSIQALQSALILAAANLNHLNDQLGRKLVWEGGVKGELGFP